MREVLSSLENPQVKGLVRLREKRERDKTELFLIEGYRETLRALGGGVNVQKLYICPELFLGTNEPALIQQAEKSGAEIVTVTPKVFAKVSYRDRPDGILAVAKTMQYTLEYLESKLPAHTPAFLVVAVSIEKPGNLGTILRTADGAGAHGVLVCDRCTDIYNPNVVRSSVGTLFTLPVVETTSTEARKWLSEKGVQTIAATPRAERLYYEVDLKKPSAIVVGTEQLGLSEEWLTGCDVEVKIPMCGVADSLNVAMATTILLYEGTRQRHG